MQRRADALEQRRRRGQSRFGGDHRGILREARDQLPLVCARLVERAAVAAAEQLLLGCAQPPPGIEQLADVAPAVVGELVDRPRRARRLAQRAHRVRRVALPLRAQLTRELVAGGGEPVERQGIEPARGGLNGVVGHGRAPDDP